ncbi:MAG: class I SAM-dependent methyltransferase [Opitutae bacterium]|nr:class I SAM-dependent methyltransferase [Opitutae bacterium]
MQAEEYRKMADVEDVMWYYRALHRHVGRALRHHLPSAAEILDAGCGTGGLLRRLKHAEPAWRLTGLDLSPQAAEFARQRAGVEVAEGSVLQLPFADGRFDAIVSCDVLCQVDDPVAALREFARCLKPGGVVVLTMPAYQWMFSYHDRQVSNLRRYTRGETLALLRAAGLAPRESTYWNMLTLPLAVLRRKVFPPRVPASDVLLYPAPVEAIFNAMMLLEHGWLGAGLGLPCGSSLVAVGRKSEPA